MCGRKEQKLQIKVVKFEEPEDDGKYEGKGGHQIGQCWGQSWRAVTYAEKLDRLINATARGKTKGKKGNTKYHKFLHETQIVIVTKWSK